MTKTIMDLSMIIEKSAHIYLLREKAVLPLNRWR